MTGRPLSDVSPSSVAVLGLGSIGLRHARNLLALGRPVVGFDPSPDRRALLVQAGGEAAESRDRALAAAGAVLIASPNRFHLADLDAAVAAGLPAFVEKPLAHDAAAAAAVLDRAAAAGLVVFAGLNMRFNPVVREARRIIAAGGIGRLLWGRLICASYLPGWRPWQDYRAGYAADAGTGGVLFDIIHEFDLAWHLLGPARTVSALARRSGLLDMPSEDMADVVLDHADGARSTIHLDYVTRPDRRATEIAGTDGLLELDLLGRRLRHLGTDGRVLLDTVLPGTDDGDYLDEMRAFLDAVDRRTAPVCDGREALAVLDQVVAARRLANLPDAAKSQSP